MGSREASGWVPRGRIKGIELAICGRCGIGATADGDPAKADQCDRKCGGKYRADSGTYYRAIPRSSGIDSESWSCWDLGCVEGWVDEIAPDECDSCGHDLDYNVLRIVDGERAGLA